MHYWAIVLIVLFGNKLVEPVVPLEFEGNPGSFYHSAISSDGIFLAQPGTGQVLHFDMEGHVKPPIGRKGQGPGEFNWPCLVYSDPPYLYVADTGQDKIHRIDPKSGDFLKSWKIKGIASFAVKGNDVVVAYVNPPQEHPYGLLTLGEDVRFYRQFGKMPCCLDVSGSQKSAVLRTSNGSFWVAFSGEYRLQKFDATGNLIKTVDSEPMDYVVPSQSKKVSRFDTSSLSANVMSFDKIHGLYEVGDRLVLYRYKVRRDSYLDIFNLAGDRLSSQKSDFVQPIGVLNGTLYAILSSDGNESWDLMLTKVKIIEL